jgi:hypothetical protein
MSNSPVDELLGFIESLTLEQIRAIPGAAWIPIVMAIPDAQDRQRVLFAKNVKVYGGINEYVDDFFTKDTVNRIKAMPAGPGRASAVDGAKISLQRMSEYEGISEANKARVLAGKAELENLAGGRRRRRGSRRRGSRRHRN